MEMIFPLMLLVANLANTKWRKNPKKLLTPAHGYSSNTFAWIQSAMRLLGTENSCWFCWGWVSNIYLFNFSGNTWTEEEGLTDHWTLSPRIHRNLYWQWCQVIIPVQRIMLADDGIFSVDRTLQCANWCELGLVWRDLNSCDRNIPFQTHHECTLEEMIRFSRIFQFCHLSDLMMEHPSICKVSHAAIMHLLHTFAFDSPPFRSDLLDNMWLLNAKKF